MALLKIYRCSWWSNLHTGMQELMVSNLFNDIHNIYNIFHLIICLRINN